MILYLILATVAFVNIIMQSMIDFQTQSITVCCNMFAKMQETIFHLTVET